MKMNKCDKRKFTIRISDKMNDYINNQINAGIYKNKTHFINELIIDFVYIKYDSNLLKKYKYDYDFMLKSELKKVIQENKVDNIGSPKVLSFRIKKTLYENLKDDFKIRTKKQLNELIKCLIEKEIKSSTN